jgi:hypothetical protein
MMLYVIDVRRSDGYDLHAPASLVAAYLWLSRLTDPFRAGFLETAPHVSGVHFRSERCTRCDRLHRRQLRGAWLRCRLHVRVAG